jgi:hypothetical protein
VTKTTPKPIVIDRYNFKCDVARYLTILIARRQRNASVKGWIHLSKVELPQAD